MVKITTYQQQTTPNLLNQIAPAPNVQIGNPIGQSLSTVSQGFQSGSDAAGLNEMLANREQRQRTEQAAALQAGNLASQAELEWTQKFQQAQRSATGTAQDFTATFLNGTSDDNGNVTQEGFNQYKAKILANYAPDTPAYRYTEHELTNLANRFQSQGLAFENQMFEQDKMHNLGQMIQNNGNLLLQDPSDVNYSNVKAKTAAMIAASGLGQEQQYKLQDFAKQSYASMAMNSQIENNPQSAVNMLRPAVGKIVQGSTADQIAKLTTSNPVYALATMGVEAAKDKQGNPILNAGNNESTAVGLFQMTDAARADGGQKGSDLASQVAGFDQFTAKNRAALITKLGTEPTEQQLYLAHHYGAGGASSLLKANPNADASTVLSADAIRVNKLQGMTVGDVINQSYSMYNKQAAKYTGDLQSAVDSHPAVADLDPQQRLQLLNRAEGAVNTVAAKQAVDLSNTIQNHEAMALNGVTNYVPLTQEQFNAAYPNNPDKAVIAYNNYTHTLSVGRAISAVNQQTPEETMRMYDSLKPTNADTFAEDAKLQQVYAEAIARKQKMLNDDPAAWAQQNSSVVTKAYNDAQVIADPTQKAAAMDSYYKTMIAEQTRQGVINPRIMTNGQLSQVTQQFGKAQGIAKAQILEGLQQQYGDNFKYVSQQMQMQKDAPQGLTAILAAPTNSDGSMSAAVERAAILSDVPLSTLEQTAGAKKADIDKAINAQLSNFTKSFPTSALSGPNVVDVITNIRKAAYDNSRNLSADDAATSAVQQFVGDNKYNYVSNSNSNYMLRLPKQYNKDIVKANMSNIVDNLDEKSLDLSNVDLLKNSWLGTTDASGYANQVKSNAYWLTNNNEDGATLYFTGKNDIPYPVIGKDGKQISMSFNQPLTAKKPVIETLPTTTDSDNTKHIQIKGLRSLYK